MKFQQQLLCFQFRLEREIEREREREREREWRVNHNTDSIGRRNVINFT